MFSAAALDLCILCCNKYKSGCLLYVISFLSFSSSCVFLLSLTFSHNLHFLRILYGSLQCFVHFLPLLSFLCVTPGRTLIFGCFCFVSGNNSIHSVDWSSVHVVVKWKEGRSSQYFKDLPRLWKEQENKGCLPTPYTWIVKTFHMIHLCLLEPPFDV